MEDDLFERGVTTKRDQGGSGLGLFIVKSILDQAKARVDIIPRIASDGGGAEFKFRFRIVKKK